MAQSSQDASRSAQENRRSSLRVSLRDDSGSPAGPPQDQGGSLESGNPEDPQPKTPYDPETERLLREGWRIRSEYRVSESGLRETLRLLALRGSA